MSRHVHPLWFTTRATNPLTQFLEEIKAMVMDYANHIRERQNLPTIVQIKEIPDRGPTKIGCGVRQIEKQSQALIPHFCGVPRSE